MNNPAIANIQRLDRSLRRLGAPAPATLRRRRRDPGLTFSLSFSEFVQVCNPTLLRYEHVPRLVSVCQHIADAFDPALGWAWPGPGSPNWKRVMVMMPTRYFKTEVFSRLFSAYLLRRFRGFKIGLASYGAELSWEISEEARAYYQQSGGVLSDVTSAKKNWKTTDNGQMWAAGVGGKAIGFGYNMGIIDDPQDPEHALSSTFQGRFERWFPGKWLSREEPGAGVLLVMQRLGIMDAVGFLWEREYESPQYWHIVCFDEIKSGEPLAKYEGPMGLPPTCTLEPDDRKEGEPLAPSRFTADEVRKKQRDAGPIVASAQRQQRPQALTGDFWRREWFEPYVYDELPADAYNGGKDWDTAYTDDDTNAASAWIETYRGPDLFEGAGDRRENRFTIYVHDLDWDWLEEPELVAWMTSLSGPHYIEEKATGKSAKSWLDRAAVPAKEVPVIGGNKLQRAAGVQHVAASGRVRVRRAVLEKLLEGDRQGLLRVTAEQLQKGGPGLDLNDVFVQAINRHTRVSSNLPTATTRPIERPSAGVVRHQPTRTITRHR